MSRGQEGPIMAEEETEPEPTLHDSLSGFIASEPRLSATKKGYAKFYAKIGQEHGHFDDDGTWIKEPTTFHDLNAFRGNAIRAYNKLHKDDHFIARGRMEEYTSRTTGKTKHRFVAYGFGRDIAYADDDLDRSSQREAPTRQPPAHERPVRQDPSAPTIGL